MIISIDTPGILNMGIAIGHDGIILFHKNYELENRYHDIYDTVQKLIKQYDADVLVENPIGKQQIISETIIRMATYHMDKSIYVIHPATAKRLILGKVKDKKAATIEFAKNFVENATQHESDAILNYYGFLEKDKKVG